MNMLQDALARSRPRFRVEGDRSSPAPEEQHEYTEGRSLSELLAAARAAWPDIHVSEEDFAAYLAARRPERSLPAPVSARPLRTSDLYLACACARGDDRAFRAFEAAYFSEIDLVARRKTPGLSSDDLRQQVRSKLFLQVDGAPPKIASYSGAGDLRAWIRVVATRTALNATRGARPASASEDVLASIADASDDPEVGYLKRLYRAEFRDAFSEAYAALTPRDRNLLRYVLRDGLDMDAVAAIHGVHRTTAGRWLGAARDALLSSTRAAMVRRLGVRPSELDSILRMIESRIEVTLTLGDGELASGSSRSVR